jgi:hypothetical protein
MLPSLEAFLILEYWFSFLQFIFKDGHNLINNVLLIYFLLISGFWLCNNILLFLSNRAYRSKSGWVSIYHAKKLRGIAFSREIKLDRLWCYAISSGDILHGFSFSLLYSRIFWYIFILSKFF